MNRRTEKRIMRHRKIRSKIKGTGVRPRLSVFRSNKYLSAQLIDDEKGTTLFLVSTKSVEGESPIAKARAAGSLIAERAKKHAINRVVFDRGGFAYAGKVRALAEGARDGGLVF